MPNRYKILYLEHEEEKDLVKNNLEKNIVDLEVDVLPPDLSDEFEKTIYLNKIKEALNRSNYDLVLTDAYFLPQNKEHPEYGEGEKCILDIVKLTQQISPALKIVVYTHYRDDLIEDCEGLEIYDIWNKASTPPHYLKWRVEKTLNEPWNSIVPGQALVNTLKNYLSLKEKETWENKLLELLENYSPQLTAHQNIVDMAEELRDISLNLDLPSTTVQEMVDSFLKQDIMALVSTPKAWGHAKHVLNVYWLGYYILNAKILNGKDREAKITDSLRLYGNEKQESRKCINRSWFVASLFHDYGLIGEKLDALITNTNEILDNYPWANGTAKVGIKSSHTMEERKEFLKTNIEGLKGEAGGVYANKIQQIWENNYLNHGILSAITIFDKFKSSEIKQSICHAAVACALHKIELSSDDKIKYTEHPLACLLRFCDEIQTWERETGLETIENPIWLQSIVLAEISELDEQGLHFRIEYIPRKDLPPEDSKNKDTRKELKRVLDNYTIPSLNSLDWTDSGLKLSVDFIFRGESLIVNPWKSYG